MQVPLEMTFRGVEDVEPIKELIREKAAKLEQVCDHIVSCHVAVEKPQQHQKTGNPYRIRIDINVPPGHEIVVKREPSKGDLHDPLPTVLRDAFNSARRRLQELVDRQRQDVKNHFEDKGTAFVSKIFKDQGYGFLQTVGGKEIYFHRNSVLNDEFEAIEIGSSVRFVEEEGVKGPQASTVHIIERKAEL